MEINELLKSMREKDKSRKEKEKSMIIFERIQINKNNPAIAQLKITTGEKIENKLKILKQIKEYCEKFAEEKYPSLNKEITLNKKNLVIESRETFLMYSFLSNLEKALIKDIKKYEITTKGFWSKFG